MFTVGREYCLDAEIQQLLTHSEETLVKKNPNFTDISCLMMIRMK